MMANNRYSRIKQRGIGLLELTLGLTIIAIVIVLATRYYTEVSRSQQVNTTISDVMSIVQAAERWAVARPGTGFEGMTFELLSEEKLLPPHLNYAEPLSPFRTPYEISNTYSHSFILLVRTAETSVDDNFGGVCLQIFQRLENEEFIDATNDCSELQITIVYTNVPTDE